MRLAEIKKKPMGEKSNIVNYNDVEFTGERFVPDKPELYHLHQEHVIRYMFASQFVKSKVVLDSGCGTGYGSHLLLQKGAKKVIGTDISNDAVEYCKEKYPEENLEFKVDDCTKSNFEDKIFDVIVSFEVIEHLKDAGLFLNEVKRLLKSDGTFIVSTPNKRTYDTENPFHIHEFYEGEFRSFLQEKFRHVSIFYQDYPSTLAIYKSGKKKGIQEFSIDDQDDINKEESALYFVAVCSDYIVDSFESKLFLFDKKTILLENYPALKSWVGILQNEVKERDGIIVKLQQEFEERTRWALDLDAAVKEKDSRLVQLQREFEERSRWALELNFELNTIKQSLIFKTIKDIASFVDKTAPKGTTRHEMLRLALESVKIIQTNGWRFYFKECRTKLHSMSLLHRMAYKIRKPSPIPKQYLETANINMTEKDSQIISCTKKLEPDTRLRNFMQYGSHKITNLPKRPLVSIIIPTYNAVDLLKLNLESIESLTTYENYEIIIVTNNLDPNSPTRKYLEKSKHQVLIYPGEYSFSSVNNFAAKKARGEFLLFLNDDIKISSKKWLESMLKLSLDDEVGAVGAKLLFPDGKLQEAGGIIWKNGFGWNYGRNKDPKDPRYNFVRDVDYCSASCLMVKKNVFEKIGGFDERFKIAYCEDSDLCFSIRKQGYRVLYQPLAEVIHFEGSTQGTDVKSGIKSQQLENQKIFYNKWKDEIEDHLYDSEENSYLQSYRKPGLHILYIDHYVPEYDKDAGSVTAFNFICILASMGHKITFWPENLNRAEPYTTELQQKGVEVIYGINSFEEFLKKRGHMYAVCIMARPHISIHFIDKVKEHISKCKIIYEASDLHYIRIFREADVTKSTKLIAEAEQSKKTELELMKKSHLSLFRGEKECAIAINEDKSLLTAAAPLALYYDGKWKSFDERQDITFIGGYNHPPNVDAVEYFISEIFPMVRNELPDVKFYVIGSNVPEKIRNLCANNKNCILVGFVPEISDYLINCRVMVAPLRYGAGVKGKITQSMMHHLPVVTTSIGAEGISEKDDVLLTSDNPKEFAKKVVELYKNKELWNKLANNAYEFANIHYSPESVRDVFAQAIKRLVS